MRLRLLRPYDNHAAGEEIELPGGIASVLVLRKIAEALGEAPKSIPVGTKVFPRITAVIFENQDGERTHSVTLHTNEGTTNKIISGLKGELSYDEYSALFATQEEGQNEPEGQSQEEAALPGENSARSSRRNKGAR